MVRNSTQNDGRRTRAKPKRGHVRVLRVDPRKLIASRDNDLIYGRFNLANPDDAALVDSARENGIQEPLVVTADGYILSGHRRQQAAIHAELKTVPVRYVKFRRSDDPERFLQLLRTFNEQRTKTFDERLREEIVGLDGADVYESLIAHRTERSRVKLAAIKIVGKKHRCAISSAKQPFLWAVQKIVNGRRNFWPVSERSIHYALLNDPPLIHASKPESRYRNDLGSYKALSDLLTRARLGGQLPFEAVGDDTRPVTNWKTYLDATHFVRTELRDVFTGYWRDLMQSQPNYLAIVLEKLTIVPMVKPMAAKYCIPVIVSRGYISIPPRYNLAQSFHKSGKSKLVTLILADHDPDGDEICHSFARSMRDDFEIDEVHAIKVGLTGEQVKKFELPPQMKAKKTSAQYNKFVARHGNDVFELEALAPEQLQQILKDAIDATIDVAAFNHELDAERTDALEIAARRELVLKALNETNIADSNGDGDEV